MNSLRRRIDRFCVLHPNFGIPNLMLYIVVGNIAFYLLSLFSTLDGGSFYSILSGVLLTALGAVITSLITGYDWQVAGATYVNFAMFFAFATLYPDAQVLLFFFIPVKIKWMAILDACYFAYIIFFCAVSRYWIGVVLPLVALLNFFVFFAPELGRFVKREQTRTKQAAHFHNTVRQTQREQQSQGYRHKCAVCGRTDVTNPELQFRYCSKCAGYHCFCSDHIFNHVHFTDENP